ncbi:conserved hypothetical protein [Escherichia coli TA280]|nr:conserved hypothetical protein [Escherichia coli TA280]
MHNKFYFFPLTKGRIKSILKVLKRNFRNNTNRDLKPQKDKNSIFYAAAYKKTNTINQENKNADKNTKKHQIDSKKDRIINNSQERYLFLFL